MVEVWPPRFGFFLPNQLHYHCDGTRILSVILLCLRIINSSWFHQPSGSTFFLFRKMFVLGCVTNFKHVTSRIKIRWRVFIMYHNTDQLTHRKHIKNAPTPRSWKNRSCLCYFVRTVQFRRILIVLKTQFTWYKKKMQIKIFLRIKSNIT